MNIKIPNSLEEITLKKYLTILDLMVDENIEVANIKKVAIWCDLSINDVVKIPAIDLMEINDIINVTVNKACKFNPIIKVNGVEYGFIPNLEKMSTSEYIDLTMYLGKDFLRSMAVMYRPIKKKTRELYLIEDYKGADNYKDFLNCKASDYVGATLFFYNLMSDLMAIFPQYLKENLTEEQLATLELNGVGMSQLTELLTETGSIMKVS